MVELFLNRYAITSELGQGSMGRVFLARDQHSGRDVVLKLMNEQVSKQPKLRQLFQQELDCMRRLSHPGVVALLGGSLDDPGGACLVMEHVRGHDLEILRKRQPLRRFSPARLGRLMGQLCETLQAAHQHGVVHRDLKPSNLMVVDWGQPLERIKVIDFGLAKWAEDFSASASASGAGARPRPVGSAGYISPEQIRGNGADPRSDLYSVGVILFELLAGRLPFRKATVAETFEAHLRELPPRFAQIDPALSVPPAVEAVIQLCLAKDPAGRPASALELGERLERALGQAILSSSLTQQTTVLPVAVQRCRPTVPAVPTVQKPASPTLHDQPRHQPDPDEATAAVPGFRPDARSLTCLMGFVQELGGRLVEKSAGSMRALVPIHLSAIRPLPNGGPGSASVQLVLTDLAFQWQPRRADQPLLLTFRPLGALSHSLANTWRSSCQGVRDRLEAHLQG